MLEDFVFYLVEDSEKIAIIIYLCFFSQPDLEGFQEITNPTGMVLHAENNEEVEMGKSRGIKLSFVL